MIIRPFFPLLCVALVAGAATFARQHQPAPIQASAAPANEREAWAVDLLARLGNTQPSQDTVAMVVEWTLAEDKSMGAFERNNPLNTTACGYNMTGAINGDGACGVQSYATYEDGLSATIATITQANFASVAQALQANDGQTARQALWASPWAASHYGYGVGWPSYTIAPQNGAQRVTGHKSNVTPTMEVGAHFDTVDCAAWGFQAGCQHWGTDLLGAEGTPVSAPFDLTVIALGEYGPGPTMGQYIQGAFADGYVFYAGHLEGRQPMQVGDTLPSGALLGFTNSYAHTHIQLAPPGNAGACAQNGSCVSFEMYFKEH